jgi:hypothetical protein
MAGGGGGQQTDFTSPPLKLNSGITRDKKQSAIGPDGIKYVLRRRPNEVSASVYIDMGFDCATISGKPTKVEPKQDAGVEPVGKTY